MSERFHIISDGSCDLPDDLCQDKNITVVPFYVAFSDEKYYKEGLELSVREFYQHMVDIPKDYPKSSMPSVQDYVDKVLAYYGEAISAPKGEVGVKEPATGEDAAATDATKNDITRIFIRS